MPERAKDDARLNRLVSIWTKDLSIQRVLVFLSQNTQVKLRCEDRLKARRLTAFIRRKPLRHVMVSMAALYAMADEPILRWVYEPSDDSYLLREEGNASEIAAQLRNADEQVAKDHVSHLITLVNGSVEQKEHVRSAAPKVYGDFRLSENYRDAALIVATLTLQERQAIQRGGLRKPFNAIPPLAQMAWHNLFKRSAPARGGKEGSRVPINWQRVLAGSVVEISIGADEDAPRRPLAFTLVASSDSTLQGLFVSFAGPTWDLPKQLLIRRQREAHEKIGPADTELEEQRSIEEVKPSLPQWETFLKATEAGSRLTHDRERVLLVHIPLRDVQEWLARTANVDVLSEADPRGSGRISFPKSSPRTLKQALDWILEFYHFIWARENGIYLFRNAFWYNSDLETALQRGQRR